jgi:hypothetical protein
MPVPRIINTQLNGQLGRTEQLPDNIASIILSGVAITGPPATAINEPKTVFSLADAEALGITAAYDTTNGVYAWGHIRDFYREAPVGAKLNIILAARTTTMATMTDPAVLTNALNTLLAYDKDASLIAVTRVPDVSYSPVFAGGLDPDTNTAVTNANVSLTNHFTQGNRGLALIEGRRYGISSVGQTLGKLASLSVNQSIAENAAGALVLASQQAWLNVDITSIGTITNFRAGTQSRCAVVAWSSTSLASAVRIDQQNEGTWTTLTDRGYIFPRTWNGLSGLYLNDDPTAAPVTDDYGSISNRRVVDKASLIARRILTLYANSNVPVNPTTGRLDSAWCANVEAAIQQAIILQMVAIGEASAVTVTIPRLQNVISTSQILVQTRVTPNGIARTIESQVALDNPFN